MAAPTTVAARIGGADRILTGPEVIAFVGEQLAGVDADGRSVCVLVPDGTRVCPLPLLVGAATHVTYLDAPIRRVLSLVPRCTTRSGPAPRPSTRSSRWWPTGAR
jgi:hypothetical protein